MEIPRSLFTSVQMTPERWQRVKAILADAIECNDAFQRAAFVESSCTGDPLLRQEVEALLVYADNSAEQP
jgi:non-specific serine/threonine protein kinase/serine/threonine-protein kinase